LQSEGSKHCPTGPCAIEREVARKDDDDESPWPGKNFFGVVARYDVWAQMRAYYAVGWENGDTEDMDEDEYVEARKYWCTHTRACVVALLVRLSGISAHSVYLRLLSLSC
jgi:hypothetical protein